MKIVALAALVAALPLAANAGEVQHRLNTQQARIDQGIRSGQVTPREDARLHAREARIEASRTADLRRHDGHLTRAEYARLNARENAVSRSIYRDKHNLRRDPGTPVR